MMEKDLVMAEEPESVGLLGLIARRCRFSFCWCGGWSAGDLHGWFVVGFWFVFSAGKCGAVRFG